MKLSAVQGAIPPSFTAKKNNILQQLAIPDDQYDDLSPKGSVDAEIVDFVNEINHYEGLVTTSSCSGRISVFVEGRKPTASTKIAQDDTGESQEYGSEGGKGGGGHWLFVSHTPLSVDSLNQPARESKSLLEMFQLDQDPATSHMPTDILRRRLIHLKFEPMILHILAANATIAQSVLTAALQSGFRESGASSLHPSASNTMSQPIPIAVRTTGLAFDNVIGYTIDSANDAAPARHYSLVSEEFLKMLVGVAADKFVVNSTRTEKFRALLAKEFGSSNGNGIQDGNYGWEDKDVRRARKREEGLKRKQELQAESPVSAEPLDTTGVLDDLVP